MEKQKKDNPSWFGRGINSPCKETQFGGPRANTQCAKSVAVNQREFYRWCESKATIEELKEYADDESKPVVRRNFVKALLRCNKIQDYFDLTNQTHGAPKQTVETIETPVVNIILE